MQEAKKYDGDAIVRETADKKKKKFIYILIKEKLKKVIFYTNQ